MSDQAKTLTHRLLKTIVVSGPCGVGKSTIGLHLSQRLSAPFVEGDDYHPAENVDKMKSGTPLSDEDRLPWLERLHLEVVSRSSSAPWRTAPLVVLSCSGLKRAYRDVLRGGRSGKGSGVFFVFLDGDHDVLRSRLSKRAGHFMPPGLLDSQLGIIEPLGPDEEGATVDLNQNIEGMVQSAEEVIAPFLDVEGCSNL